MRKYAPAGFREVPWPWQKRWKNHGFPEEIAEFADSRRSAPNVAGIDQDDGPGGDRKEKQQREHI